MNINEVAKKFNISENKLRFYEKKGLIKPKRNNKNGYREYTEKDLVDIQTILTYRILEISIEEIRELLNKDKFEKNNINNIYKQWILVNNKIHKYRLIQNSLKEVIDLSFKDFKSDEMNKLLIDTGEKVGSILKITDNWNDKWNFDDWAENYDISVLNNAGSIDIFNNYNIVLNEVYKNSINQLSIDGYVLEIGVGTGELASKYLKNSIKFIGVDQSINMLKRAKQKYLDLNLFIGEFLKLPFDSNSFDRIVTTYAFHHLKFYEKEMALIEMLRVLKENGKIIIGDMMFESKGKKNDLFKTLSLSQIKEIEDEYYLIIEEFAKILDKYKLKYSSVKIDKLMYILIIEN